MKIQLRLLCMLFMIPSISVSAQERPKLVVGIVVDQMRYDYLYRYYDKYTEGGIKRLINEGYNCKNNHYDYVPTYTGPGHAAIYTGTSPAINGIAANNWYDRYQERSVYCAEDKTVQSVGSSSDAGQMSPRNLLASTVTDQLRLATRKQAKVVGVAIKDRGSILPAGHMPNGAYWFDGSNGAFISSTYYMENLPEWVQDFNAQKLAEKYLSQGWETLLPIEQYTESREDNNDYEKTLSDEDRPVFPHKLTYSRDDYGMIRSTPYGNSISKDFAIAAIEGEDMGQDDITDFLALSFSSTDYVGHAFGPYSVEAEDTYLRLDKDIAELLDYLDKEIGKENVLVFLTADHGGADVPAFAAADGLPAGVFSGKVFDELNTYLAQQLGDENWVLKTANYQLYLNRDLLIEKNISIEKVFELSRNFLLKQEGVYNVVNLHDLAAAAVPPNYLPMIRNGHNPKRSGDLLVLLEPNWFESGSKKGTTHGTMFNYDTHIPLLWYGYNIPAGETSRETHITDIAPTVAQLLHILEPNGTIGHPITELAGQ